MGHELSKRVVALWDTMPHLYFAGLISVTIRSIAIVDLLGL